MWSPICEKVELERPLLKNTYNEIMSTFDDTIKTIDIMCDKSYPYSEAVVKAYSDMIAAYNNHEDCKKKYREAVLKKKEFKLSELGEEGTTVFLNKYFSEIFINILINLGFIKRDRGYIPAWLPVWLSSCPGWMLPGQGRITVPCETSRGSEQRSVRSPSSPACLP